MTISESQRARARYIRTVLAWHDVTQADLARVLQISQPAANRKLKGKRRFEDDELLAIAEAFGLDPANMLRPPELGDYLGPVREPAPDLLTWPKYQAVLVGALCERPFGLVPPDFTLNSTQAAA